MLAFIRGFVVCRGYPPTIREICDFLGASSSNAAWTHLRALERAGEIQRDPTTARGIRLRGQPSADGRRVYAVRIAGRIKAGGLVEAIEDPRPLDWASLFGDPDLVTAYEVDGDGLLARGWRDGDFVLARGGRLVGLVRRLS